MLSRRLLRVKVMQMVYAYYNQGDTSLQQAEKELFHSISKSYELYHIYLLLLLELRLHEEKRIDLNRQKRIPSPEDLNPNTRFIDNKLLDFLGGNRSLLRYIEATHISWVDHPELIRQLFTEIRQSQIYIDYMALPESDYETDRKFLVKLVEKVIAPFEPLYVHFEEQGIYWNDEAEFVVSMVIKTLKEYRDDLGEEQTLLPEFKDPDDREFVKTLFRKAILNQAEFRKLIDAHTKNWDLERVAFLDIVLMQIALSEIFEFTNIPVKVTLNEYIELAKHYSTAKSGVFINGVLDKVVEQLHKDNKLFKTVLNVAAE
ncbi:MAG: transcription antitermination factor NusB [Marinilabiliaceae bacterium]|nr:transcription antitermination factor NusB [Marinilabiliaceae bacterium]